MESTEHIHPSGSIIAKRYEVVVGPREKRHLMGGMGLVYLCKDQTLPDQLLALKTFQPGYLHDLAARDRFLREGTKWIQLGKHPFLVPAYHVQLGDNDHEVYLVLEYIAPWKNMPQASLREWLRGRTPIALYWSVRWLWEVAHGLAYASQQLPGFVHRDLKPELAGMAGQE